MATKRSDLAGLQQQRNAPAAAGEVVPGTETVEVDTDSPEDKEAQEWQRLNILRREMYAPREAGKKLYTWDHPTLRLSAAVAFKMKFRPLVRFFWPSFFLRFLQLLLQLFRTAVCSYLISLLVTGRQCARHSAASAGRSHSCTPCAR